MTTTIHAVHHPSSCKMRAQVENAAEIALEHHLEMICDPFLSQGAAMTAMPCRSCFCAFAGGKCR